MITIPEAERIAKVATERIAKEFEEVGFTNPPKVTLGIVFAVLEAAQPAAVRTCVHGVYLDNQACSVCEPEAFESTRR